MRVHGCRYLGPDYGEEQGPQDVVMAAQLPALARHSFPLCMQHMYQRAHTDSHLKHYGRLQLGLFLKARLCCCPLRKYHPLHLHGISPYALLACGGHQQTEHCLE